MIVKRNIAITLLVLSTYSLWAQTDSLEKTPSWKLNYGISLAVGGCKAKTTIGLIPEHQQILSEYTSFNKSTFPNILLCFSATRKKIVISNELGIAKFRSYESYKISGYHLAAFHGPNYEIDIWSKEIRVTGIVNKTGIGLAMYNLKFIPGIQFYYTLRTYTRFEGYNGFINQLANAESHKNDFAFTLDFGAYMEIKYQFHRRWQLGLMGYKQLSGESFTSLSSLNLSIIRVF